MRIDKMKQCQYHFPNGERCIELSRTRYGFHTSNGIQYAYVCEEHAKTMESLISKQEQELVERLQN